MKYSFVTLLLLSFLSSFGQFNIDIDIDGYKNDTLVVGYYLGDKQLVLDTLMADKPGEFELKGDSTLNKGFYILVTIPENRFVQFIIDEDQKFEMSTSVKDLGKVEFKGSTDNELFGSYIDFLAKFRPEADQLRLEIDSLGENDPKREMLTQKLDDFDEMVTDKQEEVISQNPNSLTAQLIKSNKSIDLPEFEGTDKEKKVKAYRFYKEHYFDNIELDNPVTLRTPFLNSRINYYLEKLTVNHPDSIITSMDFILDKIKPAPETFRFYLSTFLNEYIQSKIVGMDAVFVHLAENYYAKGKAPWLDEETKNKIVLNAMDIKPVLIGKTAPDVTLYKEDGTEVTISEMDYKYLVILFWAPDCGHCKKAMPDVVEFYKEYKDKGIELLAVCTKNGEKTKNCWKILEEKDMLDFTNVADTYLKSNFKVKYNVTKTPKIFVLDPDRKILMKNVGAEQLDAVMKELFRRAEEEKVNQG